MEFTEHSLASFVLEKDLNLCLIKFPRFNPDRSLPNKQHFYGKSNNKGKLPLNALTRGVCQFPENNMQTDVKIN